MWVLIVLIAGYYGEVGFTQKFATNEACEAAAQWVEQHAVHRVSVTCLTSG